MLKSSDRLPFRLKRLLRFPCKITKEKEKETEKKKERKKEKTFTTA
jgi:hypothetical protein